MELSEFSRGNLNIFEKDGIVTVNGMYAINAASADLQMPFANASGMPVYAPVVGVFQNMSIAGYGYAYINANTNAMHIGMNTAVTYAIMAFSYKGN